MHASLLQNMKPENPGKLSWNASRMYIICHHWFIFLTGILLYYSCKIEADDVVGMSNGVYGNWAVFIQLNIP